MEITRQKLEQALTGSRINWHRVELQGGASVVVSSYGGRIYGPFTSSDSGSMNWIPESLSDSASLDELVASGSWNVGGERVWIGPEIRYMIPQRSDYWGSYDLPSQLDPGVHVLKRTNHGASLSSRFQLESHLAPSGPVDFTVDIQVAAASNPLRQLTDFAVRFAGIGFAGYSSTVFVVQSSADRILSESWNLNQVPRDGIALIPTTLTPQVTDYYEAVGGNLSRVAGGVAVELSGIQRFKIGVKAAQNFGRLGHVRRDHDGSLTLIIRTFPNDPSSEYTEEPDFGPGVNGDSVHLYNDDGGLGGFAELEARGRTIGESAGQTESSDRFTTWCFRGAGAELSDVAHQLLGMEIPDRLLEEFGELV